MPKGLIAKGEILNVSVLDPASHPALRPVDTPTGNWPSVTKAAVMEGVSRMTVYRRIKRGEPGWRYAEKSAG